MLELAGELKIPFTTGILVGIGETEEERVASLEAIAAVNERHGHIQEVILQNYVPHPRYYGRGGRRHRRRRREEAMGRRDHQRRPAAAPRVGLAT